MMELHRSGSFIIDAYKVNIPKSIFSVTGNAIAGGLLLRGGVSLVAEVILSTLASVTIFGVAGLAASIILNPVIAYWNSGYFKCQMSIPGYNLREDCLIVLG